jgi:hypothetical protein
VLMVSRNTTLICPCRKYDTRKAIITVYCNGIQIIWFTKQDVIFPISGGRSQRHDRCIRSILVPFQF